MCLTPPQCRNDTLSVAETTAAGFSSPNLQADKAAQAAFLRR